MKSVRLSWPSIVFFKLEYIIHPILKPIFNILKFFLVSGLAEADQLSKRSDYSIEILKIFKYLNYFPWGHFKSVDYAIQRATIAEFRQRTVDECRGIISTVHTSKCEKSI
jgi:hypothetical protein